MKSITKQKDGKYKVVETLEVIIEKKALEDALVQIKGQADQLRKQLSICNEEIARLEKALKD